MANELVISGTLHLVYDTDNVSDKFRKREFIVKVDKDVNGVIYSDYAKFQAINGKCDMLDGIQEGSEVEVKFNLSGKPWEKDGVTKFFTNLNAWSVKVIGNQVASNKPNPHALPPLPEKKKDTKPQIQDIGADDLPF